LSVIGAVIMVSYDEIGQHKELSIAWDRE